MPTPSRFPQGLSNAAPWQFFGPMGTENPFFYHSYADDFDTPILSTGWVVTASTGTAALAAGDGGVVVETTTAAAANFVSIQRPAVGFQPVAGKKLFFVARIALSDIVNAAFVAGLMPITATPFTNPANGIWISKASSTSQIVLNVANNSVVTSTNIPLAALTIANNVSFDVGFEVTAGLTSIPGPAIKASVGPNLVGFLPQSGNGTANSNNRYPNIVSTAPLLTTLQATVLAPVLAVQTGNSSILTLTSDFVGAFRER
jgi:hypothetical protein